MHWVLTKMGSIMTFYGPIGEWGVSNYFFWRELELVLPRNISRADVSRGAPLKTFPNRKKSDPPIHTREIKILDVLLGLQR